MHPWASMLKAAAEHADGDVLALQAPLHKGRGVASPADLKIRTNAKRRRQRVEGAAPSARRPRVKTAPAELLHNMDDAVLSLLALRQSIDPSPAVPADAYDNAKAMQNAMRQQRFLSPLASQIKQANHSMSFILNTGASLEDKGGVVRLPKLAAPLHSTHRSAPHESNGSDERTRRVLQDQMDALHQLRYEGHPSTSSNLPTNDDIADEDDTGDSDDSDDDDGGSLDPQNRSTGFADTSGVFQRLLPSTMVQQEQVQHSMRKPFSTSWAQRKHNFELLQVTARLEDARQDYLGHIHAALEEDMRMQVHYHHVHPHVAPPSEAQTLAQRRLRAREVSMMYLFQTECKSAYEIGAFAFNHTVTSNVFHESFTDVRMLLAALDGALTLRKCWIVGIEHDNGDRGASDDVLTFHVGFHVHVRDSDRGLESLLRPELHWLAPHLLHTRQRGVVSVQAALQCRYHTFDVKDMHVHVDVAGLVHSLNVPTNPADYMERTASRRLPPLP